MSAQRQRWMVFPRCSWHESWAAIRCVKRSSYIKHDSIWHLECFDLGYAVKLGPLHAPLLALGQTVPGLVEGRAPEIGDLAVLWSCRIKLAWLLHSKLRKVYWIVNVKFPTWVADFYGVLLGFTDINSQSRRNINTINKAKRCGQQNSKKENN